MPSINNIDSAIAYQFLFLWIGEKKQWWKTQFLNDISLEMIKPLAYYAHPWSIFKTIRSIVIKIEQQQHENHITLLRPHPIVQNLIDERIKYLMMKNVTPYSLLTQIGLAEDFWENWAIQNPSAEEIVTILSFVSMSKMLQEPNPDFVFTVEDKIITDLSSISHLFQAVDFGQQTYQAPALFWEI